MTDEAWYIVRNTPGVTGFIGSSGKGAKPFPVAQEEVDAVLRRLGRQDVNVQVDFEVGDRVEITMVHSKIQKVLLNLWMKKRKKLQYY